MQFPGIRNLLLAAPLALWGCSLFPSGNSPETGSFRQASPSRLMALAEQYEQRGQHRHAARIYEELLKGDPNRHQVRQRLQALAGHGVVSPQSQEALLAGIQELVNEHQQEVQRIAAEREAQRQLASLTPAAPQDQFFTPSSVTASAEHQVSVPRPPAHTPASAASSWSRATASPEADQPVAIIPERRQRPASQTSQSQAQSAPQPSGPRAVNTGSSLANLASLQSLDTQSVSADLVARTDSDREGETKAVTADLAVTFTPVEPCAEPQSSPQPHTVALPESGWRPRSTSIGSTETSNTRLDPLAADLHNLQSVDPARQIAALLSLASHRGQARTAVPEIRNLLDVGMPLVKAHAAAALWRIEQDGATILPELVVMLDERDQQVVELACYVLGEMGAQAIPAAHRLRELRDTGADSSRLHAAEALAKIDPWAHDSVEVIIHAAHSTDSKTRVLAAITLASVDALHQHTVIPTLGELLADEHPEVRSAAALSLGGWGQAAAGFVTRLEAIALEDLPEVADAARIALECIEH